MEKRRSLGSARSSSGGQERVFCRAPGKDRSSRPRYKWRPTWGVSAVGSGSGDAVDYPRMVYSDDEVQLRSVPEYEGRGWQQRRSSGYMSDGQEVQRGDNWTVLDDNVTHRRPVLKSPAEFVSPSVEWHRQPSLPISGQLTFSPVELEDLLRRACAEAVCATRTTGTFIGTELDQGPTSSPGVNGELTGGIVASAESPRDGGVLRQLRSDRRSTASVRFRSSSKDAVDDEFYDARSRPTSRSPSGERQPGMRERQSRLSGTPVQRGSSSTMSGHCASAGGGDMSGGSSSDGDSNQDKSPGRSQPRRASPLVNRSYAPSSRAAKWKNPDKFNGSGSVETFFGAV